MSVTESGTTRAVRLAKNESLFRAVNEKVEEVHEELGLASDHAEFVCECAEASCIESITMSTAQYEVLRSDPTLFAVKNADHFFAEVESVVTTHEGHVIVRKFGVAGAKATADDPRGPAKSPNAGATTGLPARAAR